MDVCRSCLRGGHHFIHPGAGFQYYGLSGSEYRACGSDVQSLPEFLRYLPDGIGLHAFGQEEALVAVVEGGESRLGYLDGDQRLTIYEGESLEVDPLRTALYSYRERHRVAIYDDTFQEGLQAPALPVQSHRIVLIWPVPKSLR